MNNNEKPEKARKLGPININTLGEPPLIEATLAATMNVDLLVNKKGEIWLLHDQNFPDILEWAEFNPQTRELSLITESGMTLPLGMELPQRMIERMENSVELYAILMEGTQYKDLYILPLTQSGGMVH